METTLLIEKKSLLGYICPCLVRKALDSREKSQIETILKQDKLPYQIFPKFPNIYRITTLDHDQSDITANKIRNLGYSVSAIKITGDKK